MRSIYFELSDAAYEIVKPLILEVIQPYRSEGSCRWFPSVEDDEPADPIVNDDIRRKSNA